jgi:mono/diheme cytochrome c family protein
MNRYPDPLSLAVAPALFGSATAASAQNAENGRRPSERWCAECHTITPAPGKSKALSFAAIAARETISAEMIASFLRLPHATMPNVPLRGKHAQDIAASVMSMKN